MTSYASVSSSSQPPRSILKQRSSSKGASWLSPIGIKTAANEDYASQGLMRFRKFLSPSGDLGTLHGEDLLPKGLKRVRFSACLTTEYPFKPTKSNFATSPTHSQHTTPQALHGLYEAACRNREELMFPIFLTQVLAHQHTRYLTHLDFTNHPIDRKTAEPLADVLCLEFGLRHLILERCELEDETVKLLLHSLMVTNTLEELSLSFNPKLKTQGFKYIAIYIKGSQKLKKLDLSCTLPDKKAIGYIAQSLAKIEGSEAPSLETLLLQSCRLSLPHLKVLSAGVRASACLRHLSLMYNRITHQSAIWVGVMLRDYDDLRHPQQGLESLMLDGNEIKQGIQSITQALRRNQRLRSLSLSGCRIDADGCKWIGEALKYNQSLQTLKLNFNSLGPTTMGVFLRDALYVNSTITTLNLEDTGLGSEGLIALSECLPHNHTLKELDMSCNPAIGFEGLSALSLALKNNSSLTVLSFNIPCNSIYMDKVKHEIIEYCERNDLAAASQKSIRPSHGAVITKTQATARLSLQERLAAVMQSKPRSESLSPSSVHQVMAPQKLTSFEQNNIFIDQTNEQVSLFEDIMSEAHKVDSSKEILMSLYHDYKNIHTTVSNKISEVEDSEQLMRLLEINDRIMSITAYDEFGLPIDIKESKNKTSDRLNSSHSEDVLATTSPLSPLSPFEIGDDDEDEDIILDQMLSDTAMDLMSLEELRHTKEIEEGTVFKKAKETKNE